MNNNFDELYDKIMHDCKDELEILRKKALRKAIVIAIIVIAILLTFVFGAIGGPAASLSLTFFPMIIVIVTIMIIIVSFAKGGKHGGYSQVFKNKVIHPIIKAVFASADYFPSEKITEFEYNNNNERMYHENYNRYYGEDKVITHDENSLIFSELTLKHVSRDSKGNTRTTIVFSGIAGNFVSPVTFEKPIQILRDAIWSNNVKVDSSEFEKNFNLYTQDKITAMSILTADVMSKLVSIKNRFERNFEFILLNNTVYFRLNSSNAFEAGLSKSALEKDNIKKYYDLLVDIKQSIIDINEILRAANI